jgi:uncharacterized damage-inducible protein DinB
VKRFLPTMFFAVLCCGWTLMAQSAGSISAELKQSYTSAKNNILKAAEKMPDDGYSFKATPEVRAFAQVVDHISDAQMRTCSAVLGEQKTADAASKASKTDVVAALKAAFDECDKAYDSLTETNATETIKTGRGQRTRMGALIGNLAHDQEQWGIMTVYMRLKGVSPTGAE